MYGSGQEMSLLRPRDLSVHPPLIYGIFLELFQNFLLKIDKYIHQLNISNFSLYNFHPSFVELNTKTIQHSASFVDLIAIDDQFNWAIEP